MLSRHLPFALASFAGLSVLAVACCDSGGGGVGPPGGDSEGSSALYLADQDTDGLLELFLVKIGLADIGESIKLNDPLSPDGGVSPFWLADDGSFALFRAREDGVETEKLWWVDLAGDEPGAPLRVDEDALGDVFGVDRFAPSSDLSRVAYSQGLDGLVGLYLADLTLTGPTAPQRIDLGAGEGDVVLGISLFAWAPDGSSIAFARPSFPDDLVYWVDLSGAEPGEPLPVTTAAEGFAGDVVDLVFSPDGSTLLYRVGDGTLAAMLLAPVLPGGPGPAVLVNDRPAPEYGDDLFAFSSDGQRLAYKAFPSGGKGGFDTSTTDVMLVEIGAFAGGAEGSALGMPVQLNPPLQTGASVQRFVLAPDGERLAYIANQDSLDSVEAYLVELGSDDVEEGAVSATKLHPTLLSGADVHPQLYFTPDSQSVVLRAELEQPGVIELFKVSVLDIAAGPVKLSGPLPPGASVYRPLVFTPDGTRVLYRADQDAVGLFELWRADVAGGTAPVKMNGPLVAGGEVTPYFRPSPDGSLLLYHADQDTDDDFELYLVRGLNDEVPAGAVKISGPLAPDGDVTEQFTVRP